MSDTLPSASPSPQDGKEVTQKGTSAPTSLAYKSPADGLKKIQKDYEYWTGTLTRRSFELSIAIIAANWAAFGTVDRVLSNTWAKCSISVLIVNLVVSLLGALALSEMLHCRWDKAQAAPEAWQKGWQEAANTNKPWPYTRFFQCVARFLQWCKVLLPMFGGVLFLLGLLWS